MFEGIGYRESGESTAGRVRMESDAGPAIVLSFAGRGRIVGGSFALEIAAAEPICPATSGLERAWPRRRASSPASTSSRRAATRPGSSWPSVSNGSAPLQEALAAVHFERIRVEPDGRPVIRHMGGSVVWMLIPPLARGVPLVPEQARASVDALSAFSA